MLLHAQALLQGSQHGRCAYIEADARDVSKILAGAAETLDFGQPVAVIMMGLLHFFPDAEEPYSLPGRYLDAITREPRPRSR